MQEPHDTMGPITVHVPDTARDISTPEERRAFRSECQHAITVSSDLSEDAQRAVRDTFLTPSSPLRDPPLHIHYDVWTANALPPNTWHLGPMRASYGQPS